MGRKKGRERRWDKGRQEERDRGNESEEKRGIYVCVVGGLVTERCAGRLMSAWMGAWMSAWVFVAKAKCRVGDPRGKQKAREGGKGMKIGRW